jgi:hypothetical protein
MSLKNYLFVLAAAALVFAGCKKADEYPIEPVITFKSLTITPPDAIGLVQGTLEFEFTDGDGDIGLDTAERNHPPYIGEYLDDIHAIFYYFSNGSWHNDSQYDNISFIPVITPEGSQKAIRGIISKDQMGFPIHVTNLRVRYEVYIYDRALHKSNVITTSEVVITQP